MKIIHVVEISGTEHFVVQLIFEAFSLHKQLTHLYIHSLFSSCFHQVSIPFIVQLKETCIVSLIYLQWYPHIV